MNISLENITKSFEGKKVLDDLSILFEEEKTSAVLGPSGSGKTTLLNIIAGLEFPDSGKLNLYGKKKVSYVFQEPRLIPWLTAYENIAAVSNDAQLIKKLISAFSLTGEENKIPKNLSGGMAQRVSLARAIAYGGDVFLLDEPFKALDKELKYEVMEYTKTAISKKTAIFVTHDLSEAEYMSDVIFNMQGPPLRISSVVKPKK